MSFSPVDFAVKRPRGTFILALALCIMGLFFLNRLAVDLLPRVTYPLIRILVDWKGASPQDIEENIVKIVESSAATTEDATQVISSSIEGNASIEVFFEYGKDMDVALTDAKAKVDQVLKLLPPDADPPRIYKADPSQLPILDLSLLSSTMDERHLRQWTENDLADLFLGIPGLGAVVASGGRVREIQVLFDPSRLRRYELTMADLADSIRTQNWDFPSGRLVSEDREFSVRVLGKVASPEEIGGVVVANREGRVVRVRDVARVQDTHEEQRILTRLNGKPSVMLSFLKQPNANTVDICKSALKRASSLKKQGLIPAGVDYTVANDQSRYILQAVSNVASSALAGGLLAALVIWLFLHDIRRTLVIGLSVPISIMGTFLLMGYYDLTLNIFSLGALVLAVGMLVDNSVVMLENISRHLQDDPDRAKASLTSGREVSSALVASTLTNLAAILPFFLIQGLSALLFRDMLITLTAAFVISLIVALTIVPALMTHFVPIPAPISVHGSKRRWTERLSILYQGLLQRALAKPWIPVGVALALLLSTMGIPGFLGREFLPSIDDGKITVKVKLPVGTPLETTDQATRHLEALIAALPGVETSSVMVGGYWKARNVYEKANETEIQIQLSDAGRKKLPTPKYIDRLRKNIKEAKIPKANIKVMRTPLRGIRKTSTSDIDIRIRGYEIEELRRLSEEVLGMIRDIPGVANPDVSIDFSRPEIAIRPDRRRLSDFGISTVALSNTLRSYVDGSVVSRYTDAQLAVDHDIRLQADPAVMVGQKDLENSILLGPSRIGVRLNEVARIERSSGPVQIDRDDQVRVVSVTADAGGRNVGLIQNDIRKRLDGLKMPAGYFVDYGGEEESIRDSNRQLLVVVLLAVFLTFMVMVVQYESLVDPLIIMGTIPLGLIGSIWMLFLTGTPFGATVFLGVILLVGIVVNNAIVLVEFTHQRLQAAGMTPVQAMTEAATLRLKPILMTTLTTVSGLAPLALGWGEGLEMLRPLALTVVGGLLGSTFLTLIVIPCVYILVHGNNKAT